MPWTNEGRVDETKQEEIYNSARIYSEPLDKCGSLPAKNHLIGRQTSAPAGELRPLYITADHCPPEATLELETDHIFVCIERYVPRTPGELALEKGDIVEGYLP
jgi:hypothetical protein